jgi:uncharacterized protein
MGIDGVTLPPDPIQDEPTYEGALAAFEKLPPVRILFDNGAGREAGEPYPGFERSFERFPVPGTTARTWFLARGGALKDAPGAAGVDRFTWNAKARTPTNFTGNTGAGAGGLWTAAPDYKWQQPPAGSAASYLTPPLPTATTVVGAGAVKLWLRASKSNVDLQATVTEVRPDGKETFVQSGWVRGSERKLDRKKSTRYEPVLSLRKRDIEPLPSDHFTKLTVPLYYQGHVYRAGSQIRVIISAIGGDQPIWAFKKAVPKGKAKVNIDIAHTAKMPSSLLLPTVDQGVTAPTGLPPCPGLRGEPCRDYVPLENRSAKLK